MKKLLTLTLSVALASAVNAASFAWGFSSAEIVGPTDAYNDDGFLLGGYAMLYIDGNLIVTAKQSADFTFGSFDYSATDDTGIVQTLANGNISGSFTSQEFTLVLRTDDDKYEIVFNGTSSYDTVAGAPGEDVKNYETFKTSTAYQAGDWKSTAVPEPTSGLLLLLGMAGLALKRKQA